MNYVKSTSFEMIVIAVFYFLCLPVTAEEMKLGGPRNTVGLVGQNVTFYCNVTRTGDQNITEPVNITWYFTKLQTNQTSFIYSVQIPGKNKDPLFSPSDKKYRSENGSDFSVLALKLEDAGIYICKVEDMNLSSSADLTIIETHDCENMTTKLFLEGQSVMLPCHVTYSGRLEPTVTWSTVGPGQLVLPPINKTSSDGAVLVRLPLRIHHGMHHHVYSCDILDGKKEISQCQIIIPRDRIDYRAQISSLRVISDNQFKNSVRVGANVSLKCITHGHPEPTVTWSYSTMDGKTMKYLRWTLPKYLIHGAKLRDEGNYTCMATNKVNDTVFCTRSNVTVLVSSDAVTSAKKSKLSHQYKAVNYESFNCSGEFMPVSPSQDSGSAPVIYKGSGPISPYAIGAIVSASLALILIAVFIVLAMKMRTREQRLRERLTRMHDENLDDQEVELLDENIQPDGIDVPKYGKERSTWEVARKDIRMVELIGKGSFVEVWKGKMKKYPKKTELMRVAVKKIVPEATEKERKFFLSELEVLKAIETHPNVLQMVGFNTLSDPWLIIMEFAGEGTLQQYLQKRRPGELSVEINTSSDNTVSLKNQNLSAQKLIGLAAQVACGMEHLSKFKMIYHRLKSTEVLMGRKGMCKLQGFGFPQDITDRNLYETSSTPSVRWQAPESLVDHIYNLKTDVWSYGILLWEILHFGLTPYPGMGPTQVVEEVHKGYRMPLPSHCSEELYNVMLMCWHENPENRPSFGDILQVLAHLSVSPDKHVQLDNLPDNLKTSDVADNDV